VRVSTAFNRLLQIPGATVTDVVIGERDVEVTLRPRARLLTAHAGCSAGWPMTGGDAAGDTWTWAGIGGASADCSAPDCGVRTEELPWTRSGARHTRNFEDMVLWLAQHTDRTSVATDALRLGNRHRDHQPRSGRAARHPPAAALYRIGVDEVCYRHPHP
jgi:transposase